MKTRFSKRFGVETLTPVQLSGLNIVTRTDLFNAYHEFVHQDIIENRDDDSGNDDPYIEFNRYLWADYLKRRLDTFPRKQEEVRDAVRYVIMEGEWHQVYELFEYFLDIMNMKGNKQLFDVKRFKAWINQLLETNNVGYRLMNDEFVAITNATELQEVNKLETNATSLGLYTVQTHLEDALRLMSLKPTPDLRNSIKESISMVGSVARLLEPTDSLTKSLSLLSSKGLISEKLASRLKQIYIYTSDANGIRHELMDDPNLSLAEARYFLITCSAFTNFLIDIGSANNLLQVNEPKNTR